MYTTSQISDRATANLKGSEKRLRGLGEELAGLSDALRLIGLDSLSEKLNGLAVSLDCESDSIFRSLIDIEQDF